MQTAAFKVNGFDGLLSINVVFLQVIQCTYIGVEDRVYICHTVKHIQAVVWNLILAGTEATDNGHTAPYTYHVEAVVLKLDTVRC